MNVKYTDTLLSPHMSIFLCPDFFHCPPPKWACANNFVEDKNIFLAEVNELVFSENAGWKHLNIPVKLCISII